MNTALLASLVAATAQNSFMYVSPAEAAELVGAGYAQQNAGMMNPNGDGSIATRATPEGTAYHASLSQPQGQQNAPVTDFGQPVSQQTQTQVAQPGHGIGQQSAGQAAGFVHVSGFRPQPKVAKPRSPANGENEKYPFSKLNAPTTNPDGTVSYDAVFVPSNTYGKDDKQGRAGQLRTPEDMEFSLLSACNAASRRFANIVKTEQKTDAKGKVKNVNTYDYVRKFAVQGGMQNGQPGAFIYREK